MKIILTCMICFFGLAGTMAQKAAWRGENFSGKFNEAGLLKVWPEEGPDKILQLDNAGKGWGSALLSGDNIYVMGKKDSLDVLTCFGMDGDVLWEKVVGRSWHRSFPDSRSTPTLDQDRVYALSGMGELSCIHATDGRIIWSMNVDSVFQAEPHTWGVAESILVDGDVVYVTPSGKVTAMVALDKLTGEEIWRTPAFGSQRSYASPVLFETDSFRQVVGITAREVFGVDPASGEIKWVYPIFKRIGEIKRKKVRGNIFPNSPIIKDRQIYFTHGYNNISVMLEVSTDGRHVEEIWVERTLDCHLGGVVESDGLIFGSNWYDNRDGAWVCLEWETGEVKFLTRWFNKGSIVTADGLLYIYEEKDGHVAIANPGGDELDIISSFSVDFGEGQHWAHPYISDGRLVIRHGESIGIYDIRSAQVHESKRADP